MKANYIIKKGETLTLILEQVEGDFSVIENVSAKLKKAGPRGTIPPVTEPVVANFEVTPFETGWYFVLEGVITSSFEEGFYIADATLNLVGGEVDKTDTVLIEVQRSVS